MAGFAEMVGRVHMFAVHLPIAWLIATVLFDIVGLRVRKVKITATGPAPGAPSPDMLADAAVPVPAAAPQPGVPPGKKKAAGEPANPCALKCGLWMLTATVAAYLPAILTGGLREAFFKAEPQLAMITRHEVLMLTSLGLVVPALIIRFVTRNFPRGGLRGAYIALMVAALIVVLAGGFLGGSISHGFLSN